jgi:hypothetical protein
MDVLVCVFERVIARPWSLALLASSKIGGLKFIRAKFVILDKRYNSFTQTSPSSIHDEFIIGGQFSQRINVLYLINLNLFQNYVFKKYKFEIKWMKKVPPPQLFASSCPSYVSSILFQMH